MKIKELRDLAGEELVVKGKELSEELFKIRFQHGIRALENPAKIRQLRKEIARVKTVLNDKRKSQSGA